MRIEVLTHLELPLQVQHALHAAGPLAARLVRGLPSLHRVRSRPGRRGKTRSMWRRRSGDARWLSKGLAPVESERWESRHGRCSVSFPPPESSAQGRTVGLQKLAPSRNL